MGNRTFFMLTLLILLYDSILNAEIKKNPLLDSIALDEGISHILPTEDLLLSNRDLRKYYPNPQYLRYKSIFRTTFFEGSESRPMAIEIAQKYSGEFNIIYKQTIGDFQKVNNFVYPSSDGLKIVFLDSLSEKGTKEVNALFNYLLSFAPANISAMGTCTYRIEFRNVLKSYFFENTLFCSNDDKNFNEIIGALKKLLKISLRLEN